MPNKPNNFGRILGINGLALAPESGGVSYTGGIEVASGDLAQNVETRERGAEGMVWVKGTFAGRPVRIHLAPGNPADLPRIFAAIDPGVGPWTLQAEMGVADGSFVEAEVDVATTGIRQQGNHLFVTAVQLDSTWTSVDAATASLLTATASGALALPIAGHTKVRPLVRLTPGSPRSTTSTQKGWKYRKTITVTNTTGETLDNYPLRIPLGDTTPLTTAKMQADGDDVRVWFEGRDLPRLLVGMDTAATYVWIVIGGAARNSPPLPTGVTRTFEILYGNAGAANPPVLLNTSSARDQPIFDEGASSNALWHYNVNIVAGNAGRGLFWINRGNKTPGRTAHDAPGSFIPFLMKDNRDDFNQSRYDTYTDGTLWYHGILDAERRKQGAVRLQDEGIADGLMIRVPTGMTGLEADFRYRNNRQNDGGSVATGKAVIMVRDGGGESWETVLERSDPQATEITIANTTYSFGSGPYPKELYLGVLPEDEIEIPQSCEAASRVQLRNKTTFKLSIDTSGVVMGALSAEEEIFDCFGTLTVAPGGDAPQYRAQMGGAGDSGRLALPLDSTLVIDGERRTIEEWDGGTFVARREFAGVFRKVGANGIAVPWHDWLLAKPHASTLVNGDFAANNAGWSLTQQDAGITASYPHDTSVFHLASGSFKMAISANTGASAAVIKVICPTVYAVVPGQYLGIKGWVRTSNANVAPLFFVDWFNASGGYLGGTFMPVWAPTINTWTERAFAGLAPANAATGRPGIASYNRTSSPGAANLNFDEIEDGNVLGFADLDSDVAIDVAWRDGWYG